MAIAVALSIALHEIVAGFIPGLPRPTQTRERVAIARIEIRHSLRPKPTPTPTPTPTPPPRVPIVAHARVIAIPQRITRLQAPAGKAARAERIKHRGAPRPKPPVVLATTPAVAAVPTGGQGTGSGPGQGAGLGNGTAGTGDTGNGAGGGGGGCGYVEFVNPPGPPAYDPSTGFFVYVGIKMIVHRSDGSVDSLVLDYPWRYKDERGDPFQHSDAPMLFEFPPAAMRASEPPLVQYVMSHSSPIGTTDLNDCPTTSPGRKVRLRLHGTDST